MLTRSKKISEGFGMFYNSQMGFGNKQVDTYHETEGKSIFINKFLNLSNLNETIQQPELYLPKSPDRKYDKYFSVDPTFQYMDEDSLCRAAIHPKQLPARRNGTTLGCGWYYIDDSSINSVGAYGRFDGPLYPDNLGNGEWIWDVETAARKEDIKFCKRFKTCLALNIPSVVNKCAYCPSEGHAVPINPDGTQKYPTYEDGSCGESLLTKPSECNKQAPPPPVLASNGISCQDVGRPAEDNSIRLYTRNECSLLNGEYKENGECLMQGGGSYSWDCRNLNQPSSLVVPAQSVTLCTPDSRGALSMQCIQSLALNIGYSKTGGFLRLYANTAPITTSEQEILLAAAVSQEIHNFLGFNALFFMLENSPRLSDNFRTDPRDITPASIQTILVRLNKVFDGMNNSSPLIKGMSKWLVSGGELPDICEKNDEDIGPYELKCLQQAFRMAGCQAAGGAYPSDPLLYIGKKWSEVNNSFQQLFNTMKSPDPEEQDNAIKKCLGLMYFRPKFKAAGTPAVNVDSSIEEPGYKGCYREQTDRVLPNFRGNVNSPEQCEAIVRQSGDNIMGLQNSNECWSGKDVDYAKYGIQNNTGRCFQFGDRWVNQIYKLGNTCKETLGHQCDVTKPVQPPVSMLGCFNENSGDSPADRVNKVLPIYKGGFYVDGGAAGVYNYCSQQALANNKNAFSIWGSRDSNQCSIGDLNPSKLVRTDSSKCGPGWNPTATTVYQINDITKNPEYKPPEYKGCFSQRLNQQYVGGGIGGFPYNGSPENKAKMIKNCETLARDKKYKYFNVAFNDTACQFSNEDKFIPDKADRTEATCGAWWWDPDGRAYKVDYGNEKIKFTTKDTYSLYS